MRKEGMIVKGIWAWKWGFSFNEAGLFWRALPFNITVNVPGLKLYMYLGLPFWRFGRNPEKDSYKKEFYYKPIKLLRIIVK